MKSFKEKIAFIVYGLIVFLVKLVPVRKKENHLLLIKTDEIGDYILFRNYLKDISTNKKYKNDKIVLLGNIIWKQLFDVFDSHIVSDSVWIDKKRFNKNLFYRFQILFKIHAYGFSEVINCIYSRSAITDDCFTEVVNCSTKTAMKADLSNRKIREEKSDNKVYNNIISAGDSRLFDLIRNKHFISNLLKESPEKLNNTVLMQPVNAINISKEYVVIFSGAGKQSKKWRPDYFATVILYLVEKYNYTIYLAGGKGDISDSKAISDLLSVPVIDVTGKTTMLESLELLKGAKFALSVDTGSVHMAAGVNCPVIALYSGVHYGRFAPYPTEVFNHFYDIYPDFVDKMIEKNDPELYNPTYLSYNIIKEIRPEKVIAQIDKLYTSI
ncbi:MAG: glycosyltransferase family 9 protein [Taibaiella sp.]|nr:glycosyltransferase family 9 protein [Taibaiella sp.]